MRYSKLWFAVLVLPVFMLLGCGESNPTQPPAVTPVGTWTYTENSGGVVVGMTNVVAANNTYTISGYMGAGAAMVVLMQESGAWSINSSTVTFTPSNCSELDTATMTLVPVACSGATICTISGNTMTDGTTTFTRQ